MTVLPEGVLRNAQPLDSPWDCVDKEASRLWKLEVRGVDDGIFALRQSSRVSSEAPIGYLICGTRRVLLLDTGDAQEAVECPLRATVDALIHEWSESRGIASPPLVVAHTHSHYDHVKGDAQFIDRPDTTIVAKDVDAVHSFFRLPETVGATAEFDIGDRHLLITATPGHDARSITTIDPATGLMFSGDTAYPGRLYIDDLPAATLSLTAMAGLAETHGIHTVLGAHVENSTSGGDYPVMTRFHQDEAPLALTTAQLCALRDDVQRTDGDGVHAGSPMTLYVGSAHWPMLKLMLRGVVWRLTGRG